MTHALRTALLAAAVSAPFIAPAAANDSDKLFFEGVQGVWTGPGEIVAGKYKGTKFTCKLNGTTPAGKVGMTLDGSCRVGVFSQKMSASVERKGRAYRGRFLDGAAGEGLDIVAGQVAGRKVSLAISRKDLNANMSARLSGSDAMNVTVSVRVDSQMVRVIAMDLKRIDGGPVGPVAEE